MISPMLVYFAKVSIAGGKLIVPIDTGAVVHVPDKMVRHGHKGGNVRFTENTVV